MTVPVFPSLPGLTYPVKRAQVWSTVKQDALSGKRTRYPNWTYPLYQFELVFSFLRSDSVHLEWQALSAFIAGQQGPAQLFAYDDPNDDAVTNQGFGEGDGSTKSFQLVRSLGGAPEPVFLINGTPVIKIAGTPTLAFTLSAYGVVTFSSPPANAALLTWTGSYYWPVRFDEDVTGFELFMQRLFELKSLRFSSEKLP